MIVIQGINKIKKYKAAVVALGVFDGLHYGHRIILQEAVERARKIKGTSIAITFFPHPSKQPSLYSLEHRLKLIQELGIDVCIVIKFSKSFAKIMADDFIHRILVDKIGAKYVCVGKNFRFGYQAAGNHKLLKKVGRELKFEVKVFNVLKSKNIIISSTIIRKLIKDGKISQAQKLLGRRVSILGSVIKGAKLGRVLGFPTANINPHHEVIPSEGIYAVKIMFLDKYYKGICYIGKKPTIKPHNKFIHIEVHIFNFHKNIYGKYLEIQFIKLIRLNKKFSSREQLSAQIKKDIKSCRKILR